MNYTALVLEDSTTQAQLIGRMLASVGWSYHHCETVREATDALSMMHCDALLLDVFVGQHNTLLHIDRFRKLAPKAAIVLMTAGQGGLVEGTLAAARKTGAEFVLQKPFGAGVVRGIFTEVEKIINSGGKRKHVLVIDDSKTVRHFAANALETGGFKVSQADSMEAAFNDIDVAHIDLVLCDLFMPGMGGLEGIVTLKGTWPKVKAIAMSAGYDGQISDGEALMAASKIGADLTLKKPFTQNALLDAAYKLTASEITVVEGPK